MDVPKCISSTAALSDPLALTVFDEDNSATEERWVTLGQVHNRRLVVLIHTWREENAETIHVRLISAREATTHEARQHQG
ncbi:MAG: BrnT family toxin [Immundisolibacter sp.]|uniref:BrnT family toxin n=1 Tax=Immundisolibacter sp. TaxID=1934948 RepID=UPI003EDEA295